MAARHPSPAWARPATAAALLLALAAACPAGAQVIEIGSGGAVVVYDGPAVFSDAGVAPIAPSRRGLAPVGRPARGSMPAAAATAAADVSRELIGAAAAFDLSPALLEAVAWRESGLRQHAVSPAGAAGVMQLMPATARELGIDRFDLRQNVFGGAAYLSKMVNQFGGDLTLGLAAYNAGPQAVRRWGGVPPYAETRNYVAAILDRLAARAVP